MDERTELIISLKHRAARIRNGATDDPNPGETLEWLDEQIVDLEANPKPFCPSCGRALEEAANGN